MAVARGLSALLAAAMASGLLDAAAAAEHSICAFELFTANDCQSGEASKAYYPFLQCEIDEEDGESEIYEWASINTVAENVYSSSTCSGAVDSSKTFVVDNCHYYHTDTYTNTSYYLLMRCGTWECEKDAEDEYTCSNLIAAAVHPSATTTSSTSAPRRSLDMVASLLPLLLAAAALFAH